MKITFEEFIKRIAETCREDAERLNCKTAGEVFSVYGYETNDLKEELHHIFRKEMKELFPELYCSEGGWGDFEFYDDCSIVLYGEEISYRKIAGALKKYRF